MFTIKNNNNQKGESFGETRLLTLKERSFTAKTITVAKIGYISFTEFMETIQNFPIDYVKLYAGKISFFFVYIGKVLST